MNDDEAVAIFQESVGNLEEMGVEDITAELWDVIRAAIKRAAEIGAANWQETPHESIPDGTPMLAFITKGQESEGRYMTELEPAEEVPLPADLAIPLEGVLVDHGAVIDRLISLGGGYYATPATEGQVPTTYHEDQIVEFRAPDGSPAVRNGRRPDGRPRFVRTGAPKRTPEGETNPTEDPTPTP